MQDEAPETPDTPTNDLGSDTPEIPWQKRYEDLRPEYDRTRQQLKRFEEDPSALIEFIQEKHPDLLAEEDEEEDTFTEPDYEEDDPVAPLNERLTRFEQWQQQVENERGEARFQADLKAELGDEKVPEKFTAWIKDRTATLGNNPKALKQAVAEYREFAEELRGPQRKPTPTPPQPGKAGETKHDPRDRTARRARMAAALEAGRQE